MTRTLTTEHLQNIALFEQITNAEVRDCFEYQNRLCFVVEEGDIYQAIGKNARNIKNIQNKIDQKIKVVEHNDAPDTFLENFLKPISVDVKHEDNKLIIQSPDDKTKGVIIGRGGQHLDTIKDILARYFEEFDRIQVK